MQLFYTPDITPETKSFFFNSEESKHIVRVLRKKEGDELYITNGKGYLFTAVVTLANQKRCEVEVVNVELKAPRHYYLHMLVAPTKMNDRYEWFLEKATEIGVDEITPIICDHSERKVVKVDRFEKIIQSAMKQSLSCYKPILNEAISFKEAMEGSFKGLRFIAHCEESERHSLKRKVVIDNDVVMLIGPEGDFSLEEIELAKEKGFEPVTLGDQRLRTETAAIVACHTVALNNMF
ncbi:16S rRNA (uracil(1498)-N(3))-methyltransferase [Neptunitalea lumnitzerae]|uniref:Ribosomal RNA small subunit methyltransferase E n=1 Tax=Neptunitalea lumnitzerae TaxID=2965509 RepID=A0ABQ5MLE5_9FLAO|nr:16S rRNA (uracil(1498)-N(3))-methyltransferase [Neptunitalea sp. Y10]GLB50199.1 ribosomal RNA small subunit methyltransferase E [Neptunitalea sp. Y10]